MWGSRWTAKALRARTCLTSSLFQLSRVIHVNYPKNLEQLKIDLDGLILLLIIHREGKSQRDSVFVSSLHARRRLLRKVGEGVKKFNPSNAPVKFRILEIPYHTVPRKEPRRKE